jgi:hypothetical protein
MRLRAEALRSSAMKSLQPIPDFAPSTQVGDYLGALLSNQRLFTREGCR